MIFWRRRQRWLELLGVDRSAVAGWRTSGLSLLGLLSLGLYVCVLHLADQPQLSAHHSSQHSSLYQPQISYGANSRGVGRRLLSTNNITSSHGPVWEDCSWEKDHIPGIWVCIHSICILIIFIALAIICDDFFVPSLEAISEKLHLSEDVAGATFMAAGSSAPELFTSVAGVAVETDVGVGTIVGSAVFNILIIIALTAALAGKVLHLDWRPLIRDSVFYALSIGCFISFAWDGYFEHYEAIILLLLYGLYIGLMVVNSRVMDWMGTWKCCCKSVVLPVEEGENGPVTPDSPELNTQDTRVNGKTTSQNSVVPHSGSLRRVSLTGGHARRLSLISQKSGDTALPHIFHHHKRGSVVGALVGSEHSMHHHHHHHHQPNGDLKHDAEEGHEMKVFNIGEPPGESQDDTTPTSGGGGRLPPLDQQPDLPIKGANLENGWTNSAYATENNNKGRLGDIQSTAHSQSATHPSNHPSNQVSDPQNVLQKKPITPADVESPIKEEETPSTASEENKEPEEEEEEETCQICPCLPCCPAVRTVPPSAEVARKEGGLEWCKLVLRWILWIPAFPFVALFSWTIPDCSKDHNRKLYLVSFFMSVLWIAVLSFGMVTLVARAGCLIGIDTYTMGLVVIAVGTSVPDALSSILVARDGYGDMAVSNAIGSNVFDINLGLGLPFIIRIAIDKGEPIDLLDKLERVDLETGKMPLIPHAKFGFLLLVVLIFTLIVFSFARFRLNKLIGVSFVCMYFLFMLYAFMQELYCVQEKNIYC